MSNVKGKWRSVSIPDNLCKRMLRLFRFTGDISIAEYVRYAIKERVRADEILAADAKMEENEIRERLQ